MLVAFIIILFIRNGLDMLLWVQLSVSLLLRMHVHRCNGSENFCLTFRFKLLDQALSLSALTDMNLNFIRCLSLFYTCSVKLPNSACVILTTFIISKHNILELRELYLVEKIVFHNVMISELKLKLKFLLENVSVTCFVLSIITFHFSRVVPVKKQKINKQ